MQTRSSWNEEEEDVAVDKKKAQLNINAIMGKQVYFDQIEFEAVQPKKDDARRQFRKTAKHWTFFLHCQLCWKFMIE